MGGKLKYWVFHQCSSLCGEGYVFWRDPLKAKNMTWKQLKRYRESERWKEEWSWGNWGSMNISTLPVQLGPTWDFVPKAHSFIRLTYCLLHHVFICFESASSKSASVGVLICTFIPICVFVTCAAFCLFSFSLNAVIGLFFYFINLCLSSDPVLVSQWAFLWTLPIYLMQILYSNTELGFIEVLRLFSCTVNLWNLKTVWNTFKQLL